MSTDLVKPDHTLFCHKKDRRNLKMNHAAQEKKIAWYMLAFMGFSTVWGFGNVANGFMYFNGIQVIFSWILMFALYFVPYALMVGELGSAFKIPAAACPPGFRAPSAARPLTMLAGPTGPFTLPILPLKAPAA